MSLTKVSYSMIEGAPVNVLDFGADPTGVADSLPAFQAAIASFPTDFDSQFYSQGGTVIVPEGNFYLSNTLEINRNIVLKGLSSPYVYATGLSILTFADNCDGIHGTYYTNSTTGKMGAGFTIDSLYITRQTTLGTVGSGIFLEVTARIVNCSILGFRENGIKIIGNTGSIPSTNANTWLVSQCTMLLNGTNGLYVNGADANTGNCFNVLTNSNGGWGIYDSSFLGNTYTGCISETNILGPYKSDSANARNIFLGCYSEPDQPPSDIIPTSMVVGGLHAAGFTATTTTVLQTTLQGLGVTGEFNIPSNTYLGDLTGLGTIRQGNVLNINTASGSVGAANTLSIGIQGRSSDNGSSINFYNVDGNTKNSFISVNNTAFSLGSASSIPFDIYTNNAAKVRVDTTGNLIPITDNAYTLGGASNRWTTVYATTGAINTSDAREKQQVSTITDQERAVAVRLKNMIRSFKFNEAVERKGNDARIHFGVIAQEVKAAFEAEGLVAEKYAVFCYDEWDKTPGEVAILDGDGKEIFPEKLERSAGNRYGVRYEELLAFIISTL